ncbi:hypothetical protein RRG08_009752 [Elysia crispata]|uniref:Uncharacterized protein n=1 Tax=Elysia crispata TaxID=231223 RepID=A0AAE0YZX1_9GAST|nr:hypothetical protein RRG08_009752 [Elysia crispata]
MLNAIWRRGTRSTISDMPSRSIERKFSQDKSTTNRGEQCLTSPLPSLKEEEVQKKSTRRFVNKAVNKSSWRSRRHHQASSGTSGQTSSVRTTADSTQATSAQPAPNQLAPS